MLIRFVVKNLFSFHDETEFNVSPNKTQRLLHHKIRISNIEILRLSAIYGANGSGKSNLVKSLSLLESMIMDGKIVADLENIKFKLDSNSQHEPVSFAVELFAKSKMYYYTLTFDTGVVLEESLYESTGEQDKLVFERTFEGEKQKIVFFDQYTNNEKNKLFVEILEEKLIQKNELLLSFLNEKYKSEFVDIGNAFEWFEHTLVIIKPDAKLGAMSHILDSDKKLKSFSNDFINSLNTGIHKIDVSKNELDEYSMNTEHIKDLIEDLKKVPNKIKILTLPETGEEIALVYENKKVIIKRLVTSHLDNMGHPIDFPIGIESDGTKRLIDYLPAFEGIINEERVYLIDEIERSIHPITIKEIISKISLDESAKGQLIFTTHESCLLDQNILRPDEIWFAQKDIDGGSKLYSLSDFNVHNTANIENGYLNGRYGGIPFLSNLKDLNWHEVSE